MLPIYHERVDDIPLILAMAHQLHLPALLEKHLGSHGNHQGISNGQLAVVWLAYILSEGDHRKSTVQEWVDRHQQTLERSCGLTLRPGECNDDRLGIVLRRFADAARWQALEAEQWPVSLEAYGWEGDQIHLDSTTTYGYHARQEGGVMQFGHSKDHRPDLPQLKLMAAAALPGQHLVATQVVPGQMADDPLYLPLYDRVRQTIGRTGLLYTGDSKMAALATRATITAHGDYYLLPLPQTGETPEQMALWITQARAAQAAAVAAGTEAIDYECTREMQWGEQTWQERVHLVLSPTLARKQIATYRAHLAQATQDLLALTPPPGPGHRPIREEAVLQAAIAKILRRPEVAAAVTVTWHREETAVTHYVGRGRGSVHRDQQTELVVRYHIDAVQRQEAVIADYEERLGWRVLATTAPRERLLATDVVATYGAGWGHEDLFHHLKDRPVGIRPLWVHLPEQIRGLTHLLLVALRVLMLLEWQVHAALTQGQATLAGLYPEAPRRTTDHPSARRLLRTFARAQMLLVHLPGAPWYVDPLPPLLLQILSLLHLDPVIYTQLAGDT